MIGVRKMLTYKLTLLLLLLLSFLLWELFTPVLADSLPQEFEWQQVSSNFQDSSQYSGQSQQCCSLISLHTSSCFLVFQFLSQSFGDCTKSTNYNWHNHLFIIIIIIIVNITCKSFTLMVFHWSLSDNKSSQVPRTLLSILANYYFHCLQVSSGLQDSSKYSSYS